MDTWMVKVWKPGGEIDRLPDIISKGFASQELARQTAVILTRELWGEDVVIREIYPDEIWIDIEAEDFTTIAANVQKMTD